MAAVVQAQIRKFEDTVRPYLNHGPLASYWPLLEQKTKLKREQLSLGKLSSLLLDYPNMIESFS